MTTSEVTAARTTDARATRSRERIMRGLADVVAEQGVSGFSVQEVADRAGVSHRTVYRHFNNRAGLLDAYARWLDQRLADLGGVSDVELADEIPEGTTTTYTLLDELGHLGEALVVAAMGTRTRLERRDERTTQFRDALAGVTDHLSTEDVALVTALVRTLASSTSWFQFRHEHDIDGARAGQAVAWALRLVIDELRAGGGPRVGEATRRLPDGGTVTADGRTDAITSEQDNP